MAEPTLKDVLKAISELRTETKADIAQVRSETAAGLARLDAKIDAHRAETKSGFADLDKELTGHASIHGQIEKDLEALKRRPATATARPTRRARPR